MKGPLKLMDNIIQLSDKYFFARPVFSTNNSAIDYFKFGPPGEILKNNILHEWLYSNVINTDHNVFPCSNITSESEPSISETFQYAKEISNGQLPFGIADTWLETNNSVNQIPKVKHFFHPVQQKLLRTCNFAPSNSSVQFFYNWQRQRKIWWRKFSASPGRFSLTTIQNVDSVQSVEIQAEFPWGQETVEKITLMPMGSPSSDEELFVLRDGKKKAVPHLVKSVISLERAVITYLCDGYGDDPLREIVHFHRQLAPYKTSFAAASTSAAVNEELAKLALYLSKQLRKVSISTLLLPDITRMTLESQFTRNDALGIPCTIVLNEGTLKNGFAGLRSRDTTLKEQVHVAELRNHMELLLKNN